ncbi:putative adhesion G protein-coupled receptor E4P [Pluvialis apricaria]
MAPTLQNSSVFTCQALVPKPEPTCDIPILAEAEKACRDPKAPSGGTPCPALHDTQRLLQNACTRPTEKNLQEALEHLQMEALKDKQPNTTDLLLLSTEALVLQLALQEPNSNRQTFNTTTMDAAVQVVRDNCSQRTLMLAVNNQTLDISCHDVVGNAQAVLRADKHAVAFIVYKDIDTLLNSTTALQGRLNSAVVGGTLGRRNVTFTDKVNITLRHRPVPQADEEPLCVSWQTGDTKGGWTSSGCTHTGGDTFYSICTCTHFSTFAVLMAIHPIAESFALTVVTYVGVSVSLVCLFLAIITFLLCRSLWSVSVTLHLQLSICLFAANLLFLVAMPLTANKLVCAITAGLLHYLFLACFAWMFLEGLHLFLTVRNLRVLNYTSASRFRKRYIYPVGYGTPAIIVAISAAVHPNGYGTEHYCWLSIEGGFIWSFLGPVCVIILVNLLFFLTTLWTLRDKLSSLNADVTALKNTRLMTFKALAHICILGCTWSLGLLQAQGNNTVVAFAFTIVNSLQGAFIFLVHCVLNRQVTEQYRSWFRALGRRVQPQEMPTTEMHITYVTEGEKPQSHGTEGCTWEK